MFRLIGTTLIVAGVVVVRFGLIENQTRAATSHTETVKLITRDYHPVQLEASGYHTACDTHCIHD